MSHTFEYNDDANDAGAIRSGVIDTTDLDYRYSHESGARQTVECDDGTVIITRYGFDGYAYKTTVTVVSPGGNMMTVDLSGTALSDLSYVLQSAYRHSSDCHVCGHSGGH